jgi:hypothetical protein
MLAKRATIELAVSATVFHCRICGPFYRPPARFLEELLSRHAMDT